MKFVFNQYLEIGGRLQPNFANFNLDFLSKIDEFEKQVQTLESVHPLISKYRNTKFLNTVQYKQLVCISRNQRKNTYSCLNYYFSHLPSHCLNASLSNACLLSLFKVKFFFLQINRKVFPSKAIGQTTQPPLVTV